MNRVLSDKKTCPDRSGVTLVEVLMALMIMAIGVSSVAVLFPISVLRSIQATQLTNGAIVKYNVESIVDIKPELIFDPDGDFVHLDPSISAAARRATLEEHVRGQENRNYIVDPFGFYTHAADGNGALALRFGNYGTAPGPTTGVPRFGGGLVTTNGRKVEGTSTRYPPAPPGSPEREALRLAALAFAGQGDGWDTQVDAQPGPLGPGTITLPADLDLTQVPTSQLVLPSDGNGLFYVEDPELYRVVVFSDSGKFSQAFPLIAIDTAANRVFYTEDLNNNGTLDTGEDFNMNGVLNARSLPNDFRIDIDGDGVLEAGEEQISRVLLQSRKVSDYSWMLNVRRRSDGLARSVDVVVRYNNGVSATDERLFEATFVPSGAGTTSRNVWVRLPSRVNASDMTEPNIRKGKFIFDATNSVWYRIRDVQEAPLFVPSGSPFNAFDYLVTLQDPIRPSDGAGALASPSVPAAAGPYGAAMFPTGVVDIYPMGSRSLPQSMQFTAF